MGSKRGKLKIAFLSGKGGSGKTLLSVNLSCLVDNSNYVDCDVEEPNGNLFFKAENSISKDVFVKIPRVDDSLCTGCRDCIKFCKFNALSYINKTIKVHKRICHSCGGCKIVCKQGAIAEMNKSIGKVHMGKSENVNIIYGILDVGQASGSKIIKELMYEDSISDSKMSFIDCPPGSACIVMDSIKDADYCVLVAEPSIFAAKNLEMVYRLTRVFNKPAAVILNKSTEKDNYSMEFCIKNNIKILGSIPFDAELGKLNSESKILVRENEKYRLIFSEVLENIIKEACNEGALNTKW